MARLDTHVVVWLAALGPGPLSPRATTLINETAPVISPIVRLELDLLQEVGRIDVPPGEILEQLADQIELSVSDQPLDAVVAQAGALTWTRDPFDRLIVADAIAAGEPLLTKDRRIRAKFSGAVW